MKRLLLRLLCVVRRLISAARSHAGWSEDMRLTDVIFALEPHVVSRNDTVHVVYQHNIEDEIRYSGRCNGGDIWDSTIHLVWRDLRRPDNHGGKMFYKRYTPDPRQSRTVKGCYRRRSGYRHILIRLIRV